MSLLSVDFFPSGAHREILTNRIPKIGDGYCFHGDFINGWFDDAQQNLLKAKGQSFMRIDGSHGEGKIPFNKNCKPKDQDPAKGTNDYLTSLKMMEHM